MNRPCSSFLPRLRRLAALIAFALPLTALAQGSSVQGEVLETQEGGGYTYLRLKTPTGEAWAAVTAARVAKGQKVTIANASLMENFESRTLKRRFERIYFGQLGDGAPKPGPTTAAAAMAPVPAAPAAPAALPTTPVPKATGAQARTVAEVTQGRAALKDKVVVIRARVVKVNNGIMGKNWLHVQDGSGQAQDGSNDLLVTSAETAAAGDVVTLRGTVRTDVSLGAGYHYEVMVEGASLKK